MQQLSRTCLVAEHYSKEIEYVCVFPYCKMSRFLCSKCALGTTHKHNQSDNSHIVDYRDFYQKITTNINQAKSKQQQMNYDIQKYIVSLRQLIQEIQNLLANVQKIIKKVEQQNQNINHSENQLLNVQKYGFKQIDEQSVNNLINIHLYIDKQIENQDNQILQNTVKIQEWHQQLAQIQQLQQPQKIKDAKYQIQQISDTDDIQIYSGAISNDLKYIVLGGEDKLLKIWDYESNKQIKSIELNNWAYSCKFTEDSTLLYVGCCPSIYQFDVQDQFKESYKQEIHEGQIHCIYCITNTIILTSYWHYIIMTDVDKKQQLLKIQSHNDQIYGLDYNKSQNIIASGSYDKSIKLWNGIDGSLIIKKLNAHNNHAYITQVLFIINKNQLLSLDYNNSFIIWNINYETRQLEKFKLIMDSGYNVSLVLQQQFIIATGKKFIKVYSIMGELVRQFDHEVDQVWKFNTVQLDSMKAVLIKGQYKLSVCKQDMD